MNNTQQTTELKLRAAREIYRDGLTEIVTGVLFLIVALATGRPAFYWTYLVAIFLLGPGLERIRARITYPRIGYAKLSSEAPRKVRTGILSWVFGVFLLAALALAIGGHLGDNLAWRRMAPAIGGLLFAGGFVYLAEQSRFLRHWFFAILSPALGAAMTIPAIHEPYGNLRSWAFLISLACLATGAIVLFGFVRSNPIVEERLPDE